MCDLNPYTVSISRYLCILLKLSIYLSDFLLQHSFRCIRSGNFQIQDKCSSAFYPGISFLPAPDIFIFFDIFYILCPYCLSPGELVFRSIQTFSAYLKYLFAFRCIIHEINPVRFKLCIFAIFQVIRLKSDPEIRHFFYIPVSLFLFYLFRLCKIIRHTFF